MNASATQQFLPTAHNVQMCSLRCVSRVEAGKKSTGPIPDFLAILVPVVVAGNQLQEYGCFIVRFLAEVVASIWTTFWAWF